MKKLLLIGLIAGMSAGQVAAEGYVLTSPLIEFFDGKPYAIDGEVYHLMCQMRKKVRQILYGSQNKDGQLVGCCTFDGQLYSVTELAISESQCEQEYHSRMDELKATKHLYTDATWQDAVTEAQARFDTKMQKLRSAVSVMIEDFLTMTAPFMGFMRFKDQLLGLIQESCDHRHNKNCFLLRWGEEEAGKEGALIRREIKTFKGFEKFCIDLTDYLGDMAESCPKAKKMFIDILKKNKNQKH